MDGDVADGNVVGGVINRDVVDADPEYHPTASFDEDKINDESTIPHKIRLSRQTSDSPGDWHGFTRPTISPYLSKSASP